MALNKSMELMLKRLSILLFTGMLVLCFAGGAQAQDVVRGQNIQEEQPQQSVLIVASGNVLTVKNAPLHATMTVYNIIGQKVATFRIESQECSYTLSVPKGYYIVKIGTIVRKVVIR